MKRILLGLFVFISVTNTPTGIAAQEGTALDVGRTVVDSLAAAETDTFTLELQTDRFVLGEVDQQTVDVVITIFGPDGERVSATDVSARGPELFQFNTEVAGRYRIEVSPFEEETGRYTVIIRREEAIASDPEARVDQLMATYDGPVPGGYVGVVEDGQLIFARGYGMADLTYDVPFDVDTKNNIGSTSKQFTAFAILILEERGELSLDDDIRAHIPELPAFEDTVRIRHLLTHTSGYREFVNALTLAGRRVDEGDFIARWEVVDLIQRQPELQNEPGAEFNYNNSGFSLLTLVVERVTDTPFPEWMQEHVFGPLGMEHTLVKAHPGEIVENGSRGYVPAGESESGWREGRDLGASLGAGGIYTTVGDMGRWMANFASHRVGPADAFERMTTPTILTTGDTTDYGLGLFIDEYMGLRRVHHGGADMAHRSMIEYFPALNAGVIAESNNATFNSAVMANDVAKAFFGERMDLEDEADDAVGEGEPFDPEAYDVADFEPLEGRYAMAEMPSFVLSFFIENDTLWTRATGQPKAQIEPTSDSTFRLLPVDAAVTFHRGPDGAADSITLHQNGDHIARKLEGEMWEPTPEELGAYTGRFFSEELLTFYDVAVEDSTLVIRHRRYEDPRELTPGDEPDHFTGTFPVGSAEFIRNDAGDVVALLVGNGRTRDVRFEKRGGAE
ncbi:MAG: serine hydrolase [Longimicrobiales bacterium]